jgi:hypothetical protein|tara:strand:+ start:1150 stop:1422 length:273 start_codon:yes stop_codon:yes gene_type:complete
MSKFVLILYLCSTISNQCPTQTLPGYSFDTHASCVEYGYRAAHSTFKALTDYEEFSPERVEKQRLAVKFECKEVKLPKPIVPLKKPDIGT